jgi:hypothetical protein
MIFDVKFLSIFIEQFFPQKEYVNILGHDHLLEIRLLKKSARHNFIIARHHSSNNYFSCQQLESS